VVPATRAVVAERAVLDDAAKAPFVLLGERHDEAAHHRWQAQVIASLHRRRPDLVIGVEMLPRPAQGALDRFVAGASSEAAFLDESGWRTVWGMDFTLYRPVFELARAERIPLLALNVDRATVRAVAARGIAALSPAEREGVGIPAPPAPAYRERLRASFAGHGRAADPASFARFVEAQTFWDRAMAERLAAARAAGVPLVVALVGVGHAAHFAGVPHQLAALGAGRPAVLLPWDAGEDCAELAPDLADAVYGIAPRPALSFVDRSAAAPTDRPPRAVQAASSSSSR
jgi:uncharacterized iron-regulated protein